MEVRFIVIDENQRIGLAIVVGEVEFLESWWPVLVMLGRTCCLRKKMVAAAPHAGAKSPENWPSWKPAAI